MAREQERKEKEAEMYKLRGPEADKQDQAVKQWQRDYDSARNNAEEVAESKGETFNEIAFRKMYEGGQATMYRRDETTGQLYARANSDGSAVTGGSAKVLSGKETSAKSLKDAADATEYGENYVKKRDYAQRDNKWAIAQATKKNEELVKAGKPPTEKVPPPFNEEAWRKEQNITRLPLSRVKEETVSSLRKKAGEEYKKEEKPLTGVQRKKMESALKVAEKNLEVINSYLEKVARELGIQVNEIDPTHIDKVVSKRNSEIDTSEIALAEAQKSGDVAKIAEHRNKIREAKDEIKIYKELFEKKEKNQEKKQEFTEKLTS